MKKPFSIIDIFKELPLEQMINDAKSLKVDFKAKKLDSLTLFALLVQGYITTDRLSQRYICRESNLVSLNKLYGVKVHTGIVSHSSISERLSKINPEFFEHTYETLYDKVLKLHGYGTLVKSNIVRIDTTYVSETANKLLEGIRTGVNNRYGGERKQIKYGIAYNGFGALVADVFSKQSQSADDVALASTVKDAIRKSEGHREIYTFDRGVSSLANLKEISSLTHEKDSTFVARLKLGRTFKPLQDRPVKGIVDPEGEYEVLQDCNAFLKKPNSTKWDESIQYRIIRIKFVEPRLKSASNASHQRKYQDEMLLITNDFESNAMTIAHEYKVRWSIEVFFKFLKQNLSFSHLLSVNMNGIKVMLYMTLIVALLVKIFELETCQGPRMAIVDMQVQIANWLYLHEPSEASKKITESADKPKKTQKDVFRPL